VVELLEHPRADLTTDRFEALFESARIGSMGTVRAREMAERVLPKLGDAHIAIVEPMTGPDVHARLLPLAAHVCDAVGDVIARFDTRPAEDHLSPLLA